MESVTKRIYESSIRRPYDGQSDGDWSMRAARAVIEDLGDRAGIGTRLSQVDENVRRRIVEDLAEIIKFAKDQHV